jgi:hypothetical protein
MSDAPKGKIIREQPAKVNGKSVISASAAKSGARLCGHITLEIWEKPDKSGEMMLAYSWDASTQKDADNMVKFAAKEFFEGVNKQ